MCVGKEQLKKLEICRPCNVNSCFSQNDDEEEDDSSSAKKSKPEEPETLSFVTWNLDGIAEKNRKERTRSVVQTILERSPDVVFFQEVIPETLAWLKAALDTRQEF